jgi:hypothetical protein
MQPESGKATLHRPIGLVVILLAVGLKNPENNKSEVTCELRFCYERRSIGGPHRSTVGTEHTRSRQELEQASA